MVPASLFEVHVADHDADLDILRDNLQGLLRTAAACDLESVPHEQFRHFREAGRLLDQGHDLEMPLSISRRSRHEARG